jgi:hypothetical protein
MEIFHEFEPLILNILSHLSNNNQPFCCFYLFISLIIYPFSVCSVFSVVQISMNNLGDYT